MKGLIQSRMNLLLFIYKRILFRNLSKSHIVHYRKEYKVLCSDAPPFNDINL